MTKKTMKSLTYCALLLCGLTFATHSIAMDQSGQPTGKVAANEAEKSIFQKNWLQATNYQKFHSVGHYSSSVLQGLFADRNEVYTQFYESMAYGKCIALIGNFGGFSREDQRPFKTLIQSLAKKLSIRTKRELKLRGKLDVVNLILDSDTGYRKSPVTVSGASNAFSPTATSLEEVVRQMDEFIAELHDKIFVADGNEIEIAAWTLHRFNSIHPFIDGNGRAARLLMNMVLVHFGKPVIILEDLDRRDNYTKALEEADRENYALLLALISQHVENAESPNADFQPFYEECSEEKMLEIFEDEPQCRQQ